jgi:hypothetical protein
MIAIVTLLIIAFVTIMQLDRTTTASYSQALKADQLARGGLQLIVGQLQNEMGKDASPDLTYPGNPLYTNVGSTNIMPQMVGTNSAMPNLVKTSTNAPFFTGTLLTGALAASGVSSTATSYNGRSISTARWNQAYMGNFPNNASAPYWIMMTRGGPTNASGLAFGRNAANSVNNPSFANTNYVVGRIAYAIYNEGALLDINVAGYPTNGSSAALTSSQLQSIKGTLAGADVSTMGIDPNALTAWRNQASAASATSYTGYVTNFASTNGFTSVYPGDTTFVSRQDLIQAAQNGTAGLTTAMLTNLATFTRERNAPSWRPQATTGSPSGCTIDYAGKATSSASTNVFIPYIRRASAATITSYHIDGSSYTYSVNPGDPLVYRRFPLDRLNWLGPNGPQNGGTKANIQACFGLLWGSGVDNNGNTIPLWQYVGPTGSAEQTKIETLPQVLAESTPREPNFFELLQAGILTGSLGMEGQLTHGGTYNGFSYYTWHEEQQTLQIFRIGASIIAQYQSGNYPPVIEYTQSGSGTPWTKPWTAQWQATGIANLPYLNMFHILIGEDTSNSMESYMMFGLWNPHQQPAGSTPNRPSVRLHIMGSVSVANDYGSDIASNYQTPFNYASPANLPYGYQQNINNAVIQLSNSTGAGVNGFVDPHALVPNDVSGPLSTGTTAGLTWATLPSIQGTTYAGFRLPDLVIDPNLTPPASTPSGALFEWQEVVYNFNPNVLQPFNFWLEYLSPSNVWVPYDYHAGINDPLHTWFTKDPSVYGEYMGKGTGVAQLQPIDAPSTANINYLTKYCLETCDPRSLRFNYGQLETTNSTPAWTTYLNSSIWSSASGANWAAYGRYPGQNAQAVFSLVGGYAGVWAPAGLCRNNNNPPQMNTTNPPGTYASYADPDGVLRVSDSGLFPVLTTSTYPQNGNGWQGDPFALSSTRKADRPIFLNRPFYSVGELGYVDRDDPWKTLDFFTANSGDAALLDLFTVSKSDSNVVAGRINLNTQNQPSLYAVLNNTVSDAVGTTPAPSTPNLSKPSQIATDMVAFTASGSANGPLVGKDQIATKFVSNLTTGDFSGSDEQYVKARREGVTRALADVGQTRTWNLMIDIVAQAGRYPPAATSLSQFVVEGERHYWLHVAIDRFTGQVIDQQLEAVTQ